MTIRKILRYPHKHLCTCAKPVQNFGPELQTLIRDMAETMYAADGIGLAANQIGVLLRLFIIDLGEYTNIDPNEAQSLRYQKSINKQHTKTVNQSNTKMNKPQVFINPVLFDGEGSMIFEEGCLSFPGIRARVKRHKKIKVQAFNAHGSSFQLQADGLLSVALQHEKDHIDGIVFTDRLSTLQRRMISKAMKKQSTENEASLQHS